MQRTDLTALAPCRYEYKQVQHKHAVSPAVHFGEDRAGRPGSSKAVTFVFPALGHQIPPARLPAPGEQYGAAGLGGLPIRSSLRQQLQGVPARAAEGFGVGEGFEEGGASPEGVYGHSLAYQPQSPVMPAPFR